MISENGRFILTNMENVREKPDEGWIIIHPNGYYETAYFNNTYFCTKLDMYGSKVTPEFWRDTYRPDCKIIKMKLVPIDKNNP